MSGGHPMRRVALLCAGAALLLATRADVSGEEGAPSGGLRLELVTAGLRHPVHLTSPPKDDRLFVVEQAGTIRIVRDGRLLERPFLDLSGSVSDGGERGLLSVAFHPRYAANGYFYVNYTDVKGDTRIERYRVSDDPDVADPSSARLILTVKQPYANHNGGLVAFGPDGMLYVGMGDGGSAGDPHRNGQNLGSLLGKLLRLDVDHGNPYAIPRDNPLVGRGGARPEIWAWGLRNPWRFAFDPADRLLYIADVGQDRWEEIDVAPTASAGLNYGWNLMEANHCFRNPRCDRQGLTMPVLEYSHGQGCSITGGLVYRGTRIPALAGRYLYSDYCDGWLRSFRYADGRATEGREWEVGERLRVSSFGEDAGGEIYIVSHDGRVFRIVPG